MCNRALQRDIHCSPAESALRTNHRDPIDPTFCLEYLCVLPSKAVSLEGESLSEASIAPLERDAPERSPDVIFIGYLKAGSKFLHQYLRSHPSVFVDYRAGGFVSRTSPEPLSPADITMSLSGHTSRFFDPSA